MSLPYNDHNSFDRTQTQSYANHTVCQSRTALFTYYTSISLYFPLPLYSWLSPTPPIFESVPLKSQTKSTESALKTRKLGAIHCSFLRFFSIFLFPISLCLLLEVRNLSQNSYKCQKSPKRRFLISESGLAWSCEGFSP